MSEDMQEHTDERMLELLGHALASTDPVPVHVIDAAKASFTWRTIDAELAELVFDSSVEGLAGVRSADAARQVTFRAPGVEIEVMVVDEGSHRVVGQLVPPQQATVELRSESGVRQQGTDRLGRFTFDEVSAGPIQIAVETGAGTVVTEWTIL